MSSTDTSSTPRGPEGQQQKPSSGFFPGTAAMKPILIIPPDAMQPTDQQALRDNGICVVVAADPGVVKFLDPIPSASQRGKIEEAAIALSRRVLDPQTFRQMTDGKLGFNSVTQLFIQALVKGTTLDPALGVRVEQEQNVYDQVRLDEVRKIAREDARAEAAAKKAAKGKKEQAHV